MPRAGHGSPSTYRLPIHLSNLRHGNQPVNSRLDTSGMTPLSSRHQRRHGQNKVARAFLTRGTKVGRGCQAVFLRLKNAGFLGGGVRMLPGLKPRLRFCPGRQA
jgi:hypothetical protein